MTDKGIQCIDNKACQAQGQPDEREPSHENSTTDDEQKATSNAPRHRRLPVHIVLVRSRVIVEETQRIISR